MVVGYMGGAPHRLCSRVNFELAGHCEEGRRGNRPVGERRAVPALDGLSQGREIASLTLAMTGSSQ